jgi:hypothetical protein
MPSKDNSITMTTSLQESQIGLFPIFLHTFLFNLFSISEETCDAPYSVTMTRLGEISPFGEKLCQF